MTVLNEVEHLVNMEVSQSCKVPLLSMMSKKIKKITKYYCCCRNDLVYLKISKINMNLLKMTTSSDKLYENKCDPEKVNLINKPVKEDKSSSIDGKRNELPALTLLTHW